MHRTNTCGLVLLLLIFVGIAGAAVAQESTLTEDFVTPDPAECLIEPRTLESVTALAGRSAADSLVTPSTEGGEAASDEVVAAVKHVAHESVACFNAGNFLAQFAFYSDAAILAIMPPGLTFEELSGFLDAPAEALPEHARESVTVQDVMVLPDGRVTAFFVMRNSEGTFTTFVTLEPREDSYVIISDIHVASEIASPAVQDQDLLGQA